MPPHPPAVFRVLRQAYRKWLSAQTINLTGSDVTKAGELGLTGNVGTERCTAQVKVIISRSGGFTAAKMAPVTKIGVFSTRFTGLTAGSYNAVAIITALPSKNTSGGAYTVT